MKLNGLSLFIITLIALAGGCQSAPQTTDEPGALQVMAAESFLADIAQNVAGTQFTVTSLMPDGADPHAFQPAPQDVVKISNSDLFILNGGGLETWLEDVVAGAGADITVVTASEGLEGREAEHEGENHDHEHDFDPHFWLDPNLVMSYVENIKNAFIELDPENSAIYEKNAAGYTAQLAELDAYIRQQTETIPPERRKLVTAHESLGYFAERYGYELTGAILPGYSSSSTPSAQMMAEVIEKIRQTGAPAIFLETGSNPELAFQISSETGIQVLTDLRTHAVTSKNTESTGYIGMMRHNIDLIVGALK